MLDQRQVAFVLRYFYDHSYLSDEGCWSPFLTASTTTIEGVRFARAFAITFPGRKVDLNLSRASTRLTTLMLTLSRHCVLIRMPYSTKATWYVLPRSWIDLFHTGKQTPESFADHLTHAINHPNPKYARPVAELTKTDKAIYALIGMDIFGRTFDQAARGVITATMLINDFAPLVERDRMSFSTVSEERPDLDHVLYELVTLRLLGLINPRHQREILRALFDTPGLDIATYIQRSNILEEAEADVVDQTITTVIDENPKVIAEILGGKPRAIGFLVGQVLKSVKADPATIKTKLEIAIGVLNKDQ